MMKRVTKNNLIKLVEMKKSYLETKDQELLKEINTYIEEVINKDAHYYGKLSSYNLPSEMLDYLM